MKKKIVLYFLSALSILVLFLGIFFYKESKVLKPSVLTLNGENLIALNKKSRNAYSNSSSMKSFLAFKFNQNQEAYIFNYQKKHYGLSLSLTLSFDDFQESDIPFEFGFLYKSDFDSNGRFISKFENRPLVRGNFQDIKSETIKLSFALSYEDEIPLGFFTKAASSYRINSFAVENVKIGWDFSSKIPNYAFGNKGGTISKELYEIDFSEGKNLFSKAKDVNHIPAKIKIGFVAIDNIGTWENQVRVKLAYDDEELTIRCKKNKNETYLQTLGFQDFYSTIKILSNSELINAIMMVSNIEVPIIDNNDLVLSPIKTDLGMIVNWPEENWRCEDYELFSWEDFPSVLFFDFKNYKVQSSFLTRLAFFVEKAGYKGTLVSDEFLANKHGFNAHDYKAYDLAHFYNLAQESNFILNRNELILREILLKNKIIIQTSSGEFKEGNGAIISFSKESPMYLRYTFLAHESWHGIYFIDENFRNAVSALYYMFDERSMNFIQTFWETQPNLGYERSDLYLMQNEFMAYIMQQRLSNIRPYFLQIANRGSVNVMQKEDAAYIRETNAQAFHEAGEVLNSYAFDNWGLASGRVNLISR